MELPVLGVREWRLDGLGNLYGATGYQWLGPRLEASCSRSDHSIWPLSAEYPFHPKPSPDPGCRCGIYCLDWLPRPRDRRLIYHGFRSTLNAHLFNVSTSLLGFVVGLVSLVAGILSFLLHSALGDGSAFTAIGLAALCLAGFGWRLDRMDRQLGDNYVLGIVAVDGRLLHFRDSGIIRAQHARIVCLLRPWGMDRHLSQQLGTRLGVPVFDLDRPRAARRYASEHGRWLTRR